MSRQINVLAIDGGGIRGIIPGLVLAELERRTGRAVADMFDLVAGTSTGGILACALTTPDPVGRPRYRANDLVALYEREGPAIFDRSVWRRIHTAEGLLDERYSADGLDAALERYFGHAMLSASIRDVLLTSYDLENREPLFFKSWQGVENPSHDVETRLAVRATSSAPTYFEPLKLDAGREFPSSLVDGGVFAVNPGMCAYAEVRRRSPERNVFLVSLGTGELTRRIRHEDARDWGALEWVRPLIDVIFDGVSDTTDYHLRHVIEEGSYRRLQIRLDGASDDLDDASERNLRALREHGERLIESSDAELDAIAARLAP